MPSRTRMPGAAGPVVAVAVASARKVTTASGTAALTAFRAARQTTTPRMRDRRGKTGFAEKRSKAVSPGKGPALHRALFVASVGLTSRGGRMARRKLAVTVAASVAAAFMHTAGA